MRASGENRPAPTHTRPVPPPAPPMKPDGAMLLAQEPVRAFNVRNDVGESQQLDDQLITPGQLQAVDVKPGDLIVFQTPERLSEQVDAGLVASFRRLLPDNVCVVLDNGLTLGGVLRMAKDADETTNP